MKLGKTVPILGPEDFCCGEYANETGECCLHGWAIVAATRKHPDETTDEEDEAAEELAISVAQRIDHDVDTIWAVYTLNDEVASPAQLAKAWNAEMRARGYTVRC